MKPLNLVAMSIFIFGSGASAQGYSSGVPASQKEDAKTAASTIKDWPNSARITAEAMIEKYGQPTRFTSRSLVWENNAPWHKTVVHQPDTLGNRGKGIIEQTIVYRVPMGKISDLKRFDDRVEVSEVLGELSARSNDESSNFLVLNLADEIIT